MIQQEDLLFMVIFEKRYKRGIDSPLHRLHLFNLPISSNKTGEGSG